MSSVIFDPYAELGLAPGADADAIKQAYRRLVWELHPDRADDPQAAEQLQRVYDAYAELTQTSRTPQIVYVPAQSAPSSPPRAVPLRMVVRVGLAICVLGFGAGLWLGNSGGTDLTQARVTGAKAGYAQGQRLSQARATRSGFRAGRDAAYRATYSDQGLAPPGN